MVGPALFIIGACAFACASGWVFAAQYYSGVVNQSLDLARRWEAVANKHDSQSDQFRALYMRCRGNSAI